MSNYHHSDKSQKTILVTGGAGYIGSVLVRQLLNEGYKVRVLDMLKFGVQALNEVIEDPLFELMVGDIRNDHDLDKALKGVYAVAHLAAIVGDPACNKFASEANETNWNASIRLFEKAEVAGVKRFIFASTCSNYGKMANPDEFVTEASELRPLSLYAELKVKFEKFILETKRNSPMCCTALRFSTVYGFSPRLRFDLTVNEFTRNAIVKGEQEIWGQQFWRPYCHVDDLARAVVMVLDKEERKIRTNVFNVGSTEENYNKGMIMSEISKIVPGVKIKYVASHDDPRDYRVNFNKIEQELGYSITKKVKDGITEISSFIKLGTIDPFERRFTNL